MPEPITMTLAALAALAAGKGIFSGKEAHELNKKAANVVRSAEVDAERVREKYKRARRNCRRAVKAFGQLKVDIWAGELRRFVESFGRIKHVTEGARSSDMSIRPSEIESVREAKQTALTMVDLARGGATGAVAGGVVAVATYGAVGALGAASTGTAIAGLSGAAAKSATLAWLGGGSLAAGGGGMAAGAAVLGGLVAGPALFVGGTVLKSKATRNLADARQWAADARRSMASHTAATTVLDELKGVTQAHARVLRKLRGGFAPYLDQLGALTARETDYRCMTLAEQHLVHIAVSYALVIKTLLEAPLLCDDGSVRQDARQPLESARAFLKTYV